MSGVQAGVDVGLGSGLAFTGAAHYLTTYADIFNDDADLKAANVDTRAMGIALGATKAFAGGAYMDAQFDWSQLDIDTATVYGGKGNTNGNAYSLSAEVGKAWRVSPNALVTPFGRVAYIAGEFDSFTDSNNDVFDSMDYASTDATIGLRGEARMDAGAGVLSLKGGAAFTYSSGDDSDVLLRDVNVTSDLGIGNRADFELGAEYDLNASPISFFADIAGTFGLGDNDTSTTSANLGVSVSF